MCLLLSAVSSSGAQPNGSDLADNSRYLFPATAAWTVVLPAAAAAPGALDDRHLYVPLVDGRLVALARESGATVWTRAIGVAGSPHPAGARLLVPTQNGIARLDPRTGAPVWTTPVAGAPFTTLVALETVVAGLTAGGLAAALDLDTGALLWTRELGPVAAPALAGAGDRLHAGLEDGRVVTFASADGRVLWERTLDGPLTALAGDGTRLAVGSAANALVGLDAASGGVAWHWRIGGDVVGSTVGAGHVYVTALDNRLRALARGSGNQRWQRLLSTRPAHPPLVVGEAVLVSGVGPEIAAFDTVTGEPLGTYTVPAELRGPVLADPAPEPYDVVLAMVTRTNVAIGLRPTRLQLTEPPLAPLAELPGRALTLP